MANTVNETASEIWLNRDLHGFALGNGTDKFIDNMYFQNYFHMRKSVFTNKKASSAVNAHTSTGTSKPLTSDLPQNLFKAFGIIKRAILKDPLSRL